MVQRNPLQKDNERDSVSKTSSKQAVRKKNTEQLETKKKVDKRTSRKRPHTNDESTWNRNKKYHGSFELSFINRDNNL